MICNICKFPKNIKEFSWRFKSKGIRSRHCKSCQKIMHDRHYQKNKKWYSEKLQKRREEKKIWWIELKKKLECCECGENHPACLQFHHKNPKKKEATISQVFSGWSEERVMKEIKKCKVLCANCHFKFHWKETHAAISSNG